MTLLGLGEHDDRSRNYWRAGRVGFELGKKLYFPGSDKDRNIAALVSSQVELKRRVQREYDDYEVRIFTLALGAGWDAAEAAGRASS